MRYTALRKFLIADGYLLFGPELYMRVVTNRKTAEKHLKRIQHMDPGSGTVRILRLTEKQFHHMIYLTGEEDEQERIVGANCHIMA